MAKKNKSGLNDMGSIKTAVPEVEPIPPSDEPIVYTTEELHAIREAKAKLDADPKVGFVNTRFLAYTTIVSKLRVDETVQKYKKFIKAINSCGVPLVESDEDLWSDPDIPGHLRQYYKACGPDFNGRSILWIQGDTIPVDQEATSVRAGILYTVAIHGDVKSLREGITFVIDLTKASKDKRVGNESKLQRVNQSYPIRPQIILFAGASMAYRVVVNSLITVASLFTKQKILQRIRFASMDQAKERVPLNSAPVYVGGGGGDIQDVVEWTKERYYKIPIPAL